ncbi:50S ribosomal protein L1 [Planctomycetota bacterium]|jgi:large subunit ribosomal protein L1|nr:50S ribosomal protein L1 [bacterium]MDB2576812.1 50S ribosomal protein L1 [Planctomycetota bacterium]MDB4559403.1 50S ribosomal protein L1 [Planctomycetota bacterium]MDB4736166.1 50S ribosomal protein L1 [Planctomycetota bacterium]
MPKHSKRYREAASRIDRESHYMPNEAFDMLKSLPAPKFDETVEVAVRLGIDPRKTDQLVRGAVSLPKGLGKTVKVVVFAEGDKAEAAREAGADEVGSDDLAAKIQGGWMDFDVVIASPDMMKHVGKLGKVLGPQGKMPSPKSGTVTPNVAEAVTEFKAGKVEFRTDAGGNVHAPLGKRSFSTEDLVENLSAFMNHLSGMRPAAVKGNFVRRISVSTTMSPGAFIEYGG